MALNSFEVGSVKFENLENSGPLKCRIFVASHSKLLLDSQQIDSRGHLIQHPAHYMIKHLKNIQHILVSCMVAREVWSATKHKLGLQDLVPDQGTATFSAW